MLSVSKQPKWILLINGGDGTETLYYVFARSSVVEYFINSNNKYNIYPIVSRNLSGHGKIMHLMLHMIVCRPIFGYCMLHSGDDGDDDDDILVVRMIYIYGCRMMLALLSATMTSSWGIM